MPTTLERPLYSHDHERIWTAAEVAAFPEVPGLRFEVVDGELFVSPGPRFYHQRAALHMLLRLGEYVGGPPRVGRDEIERFLLVVEALSPGSHRADRVGK